jgi:hypothetical protein
VFWLDFFKKKSGFENRTDIDFDEQTEGGYIDLRAEELCLRS